MTIKEIDELIEQGQSLKQIAQAYSEIANLKIKRIRGEVERNRVFYEEISKIYGLIKRIALEKGVSVKKPKKTICMIITSNYRFYGSINSDLIDYFVENTKNADTDRLILGKAALDFFKAKPIFKNNLEMTLKDDQPDPRELLYLVDILKDYSRVFVFFSRLKSLLVQQPQAVDLTATEKVKEDLSKRDQKKATRFIFEPDLSHILTFFDSQILTLLLEGAFLESELARTASRFISMDQAETEANKFISEYEKLKAYARRNIINNQILENFATIVATRKL